MGWAFFIAQIYQKGGTISWQCTLPKSYWAVGVRDR